MKMTLKIGFLLLFLLSLAACATMTGTGANKWGRFVPDDKVLRNIQAGNLDPSLNYYYSGPAALPTAIMGLDKKHVLDNPLWKPIASRQMCMELVQCMIDKDMKDAVRDLHGYIMVSPGGQPIGVWFSEIYVSMRFMMVPGNKVVVYTPDEPVPAGLRGGY